MFTLILTALAAAGGAMIALRNRQREPIFVVIEPTLRPTPPPTPTLTIVPRDQWGARQPDHEAANEFGTTTDPTNPAWYVYPDNLADVYSLSLIHI